MRLVRAIAAGLGVLAVAGLLAALGGEAGSAEAAKPTKAAKQASAPLGPRTANDAPIEITADTLEVKQKEQLAVFRGKVDAIQGEMRLRADELVVHYRENQSTPNEPGISKIEAEGNVFVSSPRETAQGARGVYDVDRSHIDLFGDVVLTQGGNVIRGQKLEMNLATGESRVVSDGGGGRVKGLFVPDKQNKARETVPSQKKN
jgi:lipopolysaccharide export system protein LptA